MGKYIPVQTNCGITGDILISDKTVTGLLLPLLLPEIVYKVKKKLVCIFIENHNSELLKLKRRQTIGRVMSWVVTQAEQGQQLEKYKEDTQSVTGRSNDTDTRIGGTIGENAEKAGLKVGSVQSMESRQCYEI